MKNRMHKWQENSMLAVFIILSIFHLANADLYCPSNKSKSIEDRKQSTFCPGSKYSDESLHTLFI